MKIDQIAAFALVITLYACTIPNQQSSIPESIAWGDNDAWKQIDTNIISYYFTGHTTLIFAPDNVREFKYECAYLRPRQYYIKCYEKHGNQYEEREFAYSSDERAFVIYYYPDRKAFDCSAQRGSIMFDPQNQMSYLWASDLYKVFNCLETRFPLPPITSISLGKRRHNNSDYNLYSYSAERAQPFYQKIDSLYLIDPINKWPVWIEMKYKKEMSNMIPSIFNKNAKTYYNSSIVYDEIKYNISRKFIEDKFQMPSNVEEINVNIDCSKFFEKILAIKAGDRFHECAKK